jgi:pimeloyl-ACP methyl ester carboxylesterase
MATFDSDGVTIHYEVFGDGPPIVLVHGFASSLKDNWVQTGWVKRLESAGRRVVALDCRGHGGATSRATRRRTRATRWPAT